MPWWRISTFVRVSVACETVYAEEVRQPIVFRVISYTGIKLLFVEECYSPIDLTSLSLHHTCCLMLLCLPISLLSLIWCVLEVTCKFSNIIVGKGLDLLRNKIFLQQDTLTIIKAKWINYLKQCSLAINCRKYLCTCNNTTYIN